MGELDVGDEILRDGEERRATEHAHRKGIAHRQDRKHLDVDGGLVSGEWRRAGN